MRQRLQAFWLDRRERIGLRLRNGPSKCLVRCPKCHAVQTVPTGCGLYKVVCRRCGEIFLRRT